jgi:hypothetical protein
MPNNDRPDRLEEILLAKAQILLEKLPAAVQTALSAQFAAKPNSPYLILPENTLPALARLALVIFDMDQVLCANLRQSKISHPVGMLSKHNGLCVGEINKTTMYFVKKITYHEINTDCAEKIWEEIVKLITKNDPEITLEKIGSAIFDFDDNCATTVVAQTKK